MTLIPNAVNPGATRTYFLGVDATAGGSGTIGCLVVTPAGLVTSFSNVRVSTSNGHLWTVTESAGTITAIAAVAGDFASNDTVRVSLTGGTDSQGHGSVSWSATSYGDTNCTTTANMFSASLQIQSNGNNTFTGAITPSSITPNAAKQYTVRLTNTAGSNGQLIGSAAIGIPAGFTNVSIVSVVAHPTPVSSPVDWVGSIIGGHIEINDNGTTPLDNVVHGYVDVVYNATAGPEVAIVTWSAECWKFAVGSGTQYVIGGAEMSTQFDNDLSVTKTHTDPWTQGDSNKPYTITV